MPDPFFPQSCSVYRPFGAETPVSTNVPARLVPEFTTGRPKIDGALQWSHRLELPTGTDLLDGCSRSGNTLVYADGDEVRIGTQRYAVVWVEAVQPGTPQERVRAYLLRDSA